MKHLSYALFVILTAGCGAHHASAPFVFHVKFSQSVELKQGDQVRMLGVPVGKVEHVGISEQPGGPPPTVDVEVSILDPKVRVRRADSFQVGTQGLLGEGYLEIDPAQVKSPPIAEGSTVIGKVTTFSLSPEITAEIQPLMEIAEKLAELPPAERKLMIEQFTKLLDKAPKNPSHREAGPPRNGAK